MHDEAGKQEDGCLITMFLVIVIDGIIIATISTAPLELSNPQLLPFHCSAQIFSTQRIRVRRPETWTGDVALGPSRQSAINLAGPDHPPFSLPKAPSERAATSLLEGCPGRCPLFLVLVIAALQTVVAASNLVSILQMFWRAYCFCLG